MARRSNRQDDGPARQVPHDADAEEAIVGAIAVFRDRREMLDLLVPDDFYLPENGRLWGVMQVLRDQGSAIDQVTVGDIYALNAWPFDVAWFVHLQAATPGAPRIEHVEIIMRHAAARRLIKMAGESVDELYNRRDPYEVADDIGSALVQVSAPAATNQQLARSIEDVIMNAEASAPWVIPGLFRLNWRVILVGLEGHGKSVLSRMIGICASQGIQPFTMRPIKPIPVLVIDLENPDDAVAETGERMIRQAKISANGTYDPERIKYHQRLDGIDLRTRRDRAEIENEIAIHRPKLVILGPAYLMTPKHVYGGHQENDEDSTMPVLRILNELRFRYGFALLIEHHPPNSREMRPMGSVRWRSWPEMGISMVPAKNSRTTFELERFRGDRLTNSWPDTVSMSQVWPWDAAWKHGMPMIDEQVNVPANTMSPLDEPF